MQGIILALWIKQLRKQTKDVYFHELSSTGTDNKQQKQGKGYVK